MKLCVMCIHNNFVVERTDWDLKDLLGCIGNKSPKRSSYLPIWKNAISILSNFTLLLVSSFFVKKEVNDLLCRDNDLLLCHICIYVIKFEKILVHLFNPIFM